MCTICYACDTYALKWVYSFCIRMFFTIFIKIPLYCNLRRFK